MTKDFYSISQFCEAVGFSRGTFYNLAKIGKAPRVMRIGRRVVISAESVEQWRRATEATSVGEVA